MVNDFKKPPEPQIFYMPIWTKAELKAIAPLFPNAASIWSDRFKILGGIPRHVLEVTSRNPIQLLEAACADCSLDDCIKKIGLDSTITDKSKVVHALVHITSSDPYTEASVCFASETALNIIVRKKGDEAKRQLKDLFTSSQGNPLTAALCGYIFEPYAIEMLEKGGDFTFRKLIPGRRGARSSKKAKTDEITLLKIKSSKKKVVDKVKENQTTDQLYVPKTANYTAIDAWIPGLGAFQMTVGKKHSIKKAAIEDLNILEKKLYWLLPPLYYEDFTKKQPYDIDQYAVLIEYPRNV